MQGVRKAYDPELAEWSSRAERELRSWLRGHGYEYTRLPEGKTGIDGLCENGFERFYVEVERRSPKAWKSGKFPFPTVHVPSRRARYGSDEWLLFVVRQDVQAGLVVFPSQSMLPERLKEVSNRYVARGEMMFDVPVIEALPIDLTEINGDPIAVMNARRVRNLSETLVALQVLGDVPPYGIDHEEWRELKDKAEQPLSEKLFGDCNCKDKPHRVIPYPHDRRLETEICQCGRWYGNRKISGK